MKTKWISEMKGASSVLLAALSLVSLPAVAADTNAPAAPPALTPQQLFEGGSKSYNNWLEFSAGGLLTRGDAAQAAQVQHLHSGAFGGIEDLHLQQNLDKTTLFTLDGHGILDQHDYGLRLGVTREDLGFLRFGIENFRTWHDPSGGFFPADRQFYSLQNDALGLDRGQLFFEAGWTPKNAPKITFKYAHTYREGEKSSTAWGPVDTVAGTRNIFPGFYDIDEKSDSFQLDVAHRLKATDLGLGLRYETGSLDNALKTFSFPNDPTVQRRITDSQGTSYDLFSAHLTTETWFKNNLMFSSGFMFEDLDNSFSGSRIYGDDFDVPLVPDPLNGLGDLSLNGGSHKREYVVNLNLLTEPIRSLTVVPSLRIMDEDWNANSSGVGTLVDFAPQQFASRSDRDLLQVRERVDMRYTGVTNWVFFAGPEWTEGQGSLTELGGLSQVAGIGVPPVSVSTDDSQFYQKYFLGARWYPCRWANFEAGGYFKDNRYTYDNGPLGHTSYPAFLVMQGFQTTDGNLRLTLRPLQNVTLVSRYEFQYSTIQTRPDPASGFGEADNSKMTSHIIAQNVTWTPWSRLSLQAGGNLVVSDTKSAASDYTQSVLTAENNYWTANFNSTFVVDDKTDLNVGYYYYQSADFQNNSIAGLPLGAAAREHGITAMVSRRLAENLRLNVKYGYSNFEDIASGRNNDYEAHLLFASLQYRF